MIAIALTAALEIFAATGPAHWSECGTNGCWRQPPLPSTMQLDTRAWQLGVRWKDLEVAYHDLGRVRADGTFVEDWDYDPHVHKVREGAPKAHSRSDQHTTGVTVQYAPRFAMGHGFSVQPGVGVLRFHQSQTIDAQYGEHLQYQANWSGGGNGWTPVAGLRAMYTYRRASVAVGSEWYLRPRLAMSVAGGGSDHPVGLRTVFAEVRYAF